MTKSTFEIQLRDLGFQRISFFTVEPPECFLKINDVMQLSRKSVAKYSGVENVR